MERNKPYMTQAYMAPKSQPDASTRYLSELTNHKILTPCIGRAVAGKPPTSDYQKRN